MSATANKSAAVLKEMLKGGVVSYQAIFAKALKNVPCAVFLSQAYFRQENALYKSPETHKNFNGLGYFSMTAAEWYESTGMTDEQQKTARERLVKFGILHEIKTGLPARIWSRIDIEKLTSVVFSYLETREQVSGKHGNCVPGSTEPMFPGNPDSKFPGNPEHIYVESIESLESLNREITETHVSECALEQTEVETSTPQSEKKSKQKTPGGRAGAGVAPGDEMQIAIEAIQYLNAKARRSFRTTTGNTKGVLARVKEGFTLEQIKKMIDYKCREWLQRPEMTEYLNPITLFRDSNFERYYQAAEHCTTIGPTHNPVAGPATYQRLQYTSPVPNEVQAF